MTTSNPDGVYKVLRILLGLTGSWPKGEASSQYKLRKVINLICVNTFLFLYIIQSLKEFEGAKSISHSAVVNLECIIYILKLLLFYYKKGELTEIIKSMNDPILKSYDEEFDVYMKNKIKVFTKLSVTFQSTIAITAFAVGLVPFFGNDFNKELPFPILIDLKRSSLAIYIIFWIFEVGTMIIASLTNVSMDILACSFMGITSAHLEILREQLKKTANITDNDGLTKRQYLDVYGRTDKVVLQKIKKCVNYHAVIERLVLLVDDMFNTAFLIQFLGSLLIICVSSFTLILHPIATVRFMVSFLCFVCVFLQLAIYCAFGNDVIVQSSKITDACYSSEWWSCGSSVRKSLFIIMERTKRPYEFTAGKFIIISLSSFLMICKSSFSYITMLNKMYTKSTESSSGS